MTQINIPQRSLAIRLLNDNDPNAIHPDNPEAADNIMALASLAAYKAFCEVGVWYESRQRHYEDAVQEAAVSLVMYTERGVRRAYSLAKKRNINWIIRFVWQGKPRTSKERANGTQTLLPIGPSLDAYDWDWLANEHPTPFDSLLGTDSMDEREACIEALYDIVVDIVSKQMGLTRRQYYTAQKDAKVLVCALRSKNTQALMHEFDCSMSEASAKLRKARKRLSAFLEEKGEEAIAQMYQGSKTWCDARAREAFVTNYVAERQATHLSSEVGYQMKREKSPSHSIIKEWTWKARALWEEEEG